MNAVTILATDKEVQLVRNTAAADLTPSELNVFIHMARGWRLDPLRRQIYALVYNKNNPAKRRVTYVTAIDGYRAIADRTKCYRPGKVEVFCDPELKCDITNPRGVDYASATVWKFAQNEWFEYAATVYWDEFAPLKEIWAWDEEQGKNAPTGKFELDTKGQWGKMGRHMLGKCAEALALRRGWPDDLSGLYIDEEVDQIRAREMIDITPTEQAERADQTTLQEKIGGPGIIFDWCDGEPLENVPLGKIHDSVSAFIAEYKDEFPERIELFAERNRQAMRQFYTHDTGAALDIDTIEVGREAAA